MFLTKNGCKYIYKKQKKYIQKKTKTVSDILTNSDIYILVYHLLSWEIESATKIQILDENVCISF